MSAPTIRWSHVAPSFFGRHIKANSPHGHMLNTWKDTVQYDLHKGPYLCASCDNAVFGSWETYFIRRVWPNLFTAKGSWSDERSLKLLLSIAYRYALHFLATSPIPGHAAYSTYMRDLTKRALQDSSKISKSVYVYPYVRRPIVKDCRLLPGINHLLSLGVNAECLPQEPGLPNAMVIMIPELLVLFCDGDLSTYPGNELSSPKALTCGGRFDPLRDNADMPQFMCSVLNRWIGEGQAHQKSLGRWKLTYGRDKLINPHKICYLATDQDTALLKWQRANCQ